MKLWPTTIKNKCFVKMLWHLLGECVKATILLVCSICIVNLFFFFPRHQFVLFFSIVFFYCSYNVFHYSSTVPFWLATLSFFLFFLSFVCTFFLLLYISLYIQCFCTVHLQCHFVEPLFFFFFLLSFEQ